MYWPGFSSWPWNQHSTSIIFRSHLSQNRPRLTWTGKHQDILKTLFLLIKQILFIIWVLIFAYQSVWVEHLLVEKHHPRSQRWCAATGSRMQSEMNTDSELNSRSFPPSAHWRSCSVLPHLCNLLHMEAEEHVQYQNKSPLRAKNNGWFLLSNWSVTFHSTVMFRDAPWLPNIHHTWSCWDGPRDKSRLLQVTADPQTSQSDVLFWFWWSENCELACSGTCSSLWQAPFAAGQLLVGVTGRHSWETCSHFELIFSEGFQAVYFYQTFVELCSMSCCLRTHDEIKSSVDLFLFST